MSKKNFNPDSPQLKNKVVHESGDVGGLLVGNRHSEGGIKAYNKSTGQPLEMEGGEVVITRNAVSDPKKRKFNGEMLTNRQILSKINKSGGGIAFEKGGNVPDRMDFDTEKEYEYGGETIKTADLLKAFSKKGEESPTKKSVAKKNNVSLNYVEDKLIDGIKEEHEHTDNNTIAERIALDHLQEDINYYDKLKKITKPNNKIFIDTKKETHKKYFSNLTYGEFLYRYSLGLKIEKKLTGKQGNTQTIIKNLLNDPEYYIKKNDKFLAETRKLRKKSKRTNGLKYSRGGRIGKYWRVLKREKELYARFSSLFLNKHNPIISKITLDPYNETIVKKRENFSFSALKEALKLYWNGGYGIDSVESLWYDTTEDLGSSSLYSKKIVYDNARNTLSVLNPETLVEATFLRYVKRNLKNSNKAFNMFWFIFGNKIDFNAMTRVGQKSQVWIKTNVGLTSKAESLQEMFGIAYQNYVESGELTDFKANVFVGSDSGFKISDLCEFTVHTDSNGGKMLQLLINGRFFTLFDTFRDFSKTDRKVHDLLINFDKILLKNDEYCNLRDFIQNSYGWILTDKHKTYFDKFKSTPQNPSASSSTANVSSKSVLKKERYQPVLTYLYNDVSVSKPCYNLFDLKKKAYKIALLSDTVTIDVYDNLTGDRYEIARLKPRVNGKRKYVQYAYTDIDGSIVEAPVESLDVFTFKEWANKILNFNAKPTDGFKEFMYYSLKRNGLSLACDKKFKNKKIWKSIGSPVNNFYAHIYSGSNKVQEIKINTFQELIYQISNAYKRQPSFTRAIITNDYDAKITEITIKRINNQNFGTNTLVVNISSNQSIPLLAFSLNDFIYLLETRKDFSNFNYSTFIRKSIDKEYEFLSILYLYNPKLYSKIDDDKIYFDSIPATSFGNLKNLLVEFYAVNSSNWGTESEILLDISKIAIANIQDFGLGVRGYGKIGNNFPLSHLNLFDFVSFIDVDTNIKSFLSSGRSIIDNPFLSKGLSFNNSLFLKSLDEVVDKKLKKDIESPVIYLKSKTGQFAVIDSLQELINVGSRYNLFYVNHFPLGDISTDGSNYLFSTIDKSKRYILSHDELNLKKFKEIILESLKIYDTDINLRLFLANSMYRVMKKHYLAGKDVNPIDIDTTASNQPIAKPVSQPKPKDLTVDDAFKKFTAQSEKLIISKKDLVDISQDDEVLLKKQKELEDLLFLLPLFNETKHQVERTQILKQIEKIHKWIERYKIESNESLVSKASDLFTFQGLISYYYNQSTQNPTAKLEPPCNLLTPNSKKSKLPLSAYVNVRTPQFKEWFGDWETAYATDNYNNCSLMINEITKEPQIFYHGVRKFMPSFTATAMGQGVKRPYGTFDPPNFPASYFSDKKDYAQFYGGIAENLKKPHPDYKPFIYSVFLNIRKPVDLTPLPFKISYQVMIDYLFVAYGIRLEVNQQLLKGLNGDMEKEMANWVFARNDINFIETLKDYGYDALIQTGDIPVYRKDGSIEPDRDKHRKEKEILTFYPNQVKSVQVRKSYYFDFFEDIRFKKGGYVRI